MDTIDRKSHGKHLILDLEIQKKINSKDMYEFLNRLPDRIGMKKIAKPKIYKAIDYPYGYTGIVILSTSHIAFHTYEYKNRMTTMAFDVYSCKNFSTIKIMKSIYEFLGKYTVIRKVSMNRYA